MIVSIVNTKGGTAKTTTAIYLGCAFSHVGKSVTVIDLDRQGSASDWADRAVEADDALPFIVTDTNPRRLENLAQEKSAGGGVVIIDTPPGDPLIIDAAIKIADFVVVPTHASGLDVSRVWPTLNFLKSVPHGVLITSARTGTTQLREAISTFKEYDISLFDTFIPMRESIKATFGRTPKNDEGYEKVAQEIQEAFK
ncbi:AAA family ATPase [Corynebacterium mastitidis]|uniref:AAA family ATPase n=1 Tax=Corynebacterium mastitidis TaxID=161890 RepID=UPI000A072893|nr:AAA family ATPase [Corynebacterium mastitidis]